MTEVLNIQALAHPVPAHMQQPLKMGTTFVSSIFNNLVHIHDVRHGDMAMFLSKVYALGMIILKHDMEDAVGVWLVHKHFDVAQSERIVAQLDTDAEHGNILSVNPESVDEAQGTLPVFFALADDSWAPMQYVREPSQSTVVAERVRTLAAATTFVSEYGACVRALGMEKMLGLCVLTNEILASDKDLKMMEITTEGKRNQTLYLITADEVDADKASQSTTCWSFRRHGDDGVTTCRTNCYCDWNDVHKHSGTAHY